MSFLLSLNAQVQYTRTSSSQIRISAAEYNLGPANLTRPIISNPASCWGTRFKRRVICFIRTFIIVVSLQLYNIPTMAPPTATDTITNTVTMQAPQSAQAEGAEKAKIKMQMPTMPAFEDKMKEREYLKGRLAAAFRIFGDKGYDEGKE